MPERHPNNTLRELIHPLNTPEIAFQSYELLAGDGDYRKRQEIAFMAGEIVNPTLDYPKLRRTDLNDRIYVLNGVLDVVDREDNPMVREAVWNTASYRLAEMHWLKSLLVTTEDARYVGRLDAGKAARTQALNEELYGAPEAGVVEAIRAEVGAQLDEKEFSGIGQTLRHELAEGTAIRAGDETIEIPPLPVSQAPRPEPVPQELLAYLNARMYREHGNIAEYIDRYYDKNVAVRAEGDRRFAPPDLMNIFTTVHEMFDPQGQSGIGIIYDPSATAISWETAQMGVIVGGKRPPIEKPATVFAKVCHEYIWHGGKSIAGLASQLPVLGTGLYTDADAGEYSDYLTFEESAASTIEKAIGGGEEGTEAWVPMDFERYSAIASAYQGLSFRQIFELQWRQRALMLTETSTEPTPKQIQTAKNNAYVSVVRGLRGTPTELARIDGTEPIPYTYNKDLAYLTGKFMMRGFWERFGGDPATLDLCFKGKFDPLNRRQLALARQFLAK